MPDIQYTLKNLALNSLINSISPEAKTFAINQYFAYYPSSEASEMFLSEPQLFDNLVQHGSNEDDLVEWMRSAEMALEDAYEDQPKQKTLAMMIECAKSADRLRDYSSVQYDDTKQKLEAISALLTQASKILSTIPSVDQDYFNDFHVEGGRLPLCLLRAESAAGELVEDYAKQYEVTEQKYASDAF